MIINNIKLLSLGVVVLVILIISGVSFYLYLNIYRKTGYQIKNNQVYYLAWNEGNGFGEVVLNADLKSFVKISEKYAKDKDTVFFVGRPIKSADPLSFSLIKIDASKIEDVYSKDKNHVFKFDSIVKNADPSTFIPSEER